MTTIKEKFVLDGWLANAAQKSGIFWFRIIQFLAKYLDTERKVLIVLNEDLSWEMVSDSDLDALDLEAIIGLELFYLKKKEISAVNRFFETENSADLSLELLKKLLFLIEKKRECKEWTTSQKRRYDLTCI